MSRTFVIPGESLVRIRFGSHLGAGSIIGLSGTVVNPILGNAQYELGLATREIIVNPVYYYRDVLTNDFGSKVPADIATDLQMYRVEMELNNYDPAILNACMQESMGGGRILFVNGQGFPIGNGLTMVGAGTMLGGGVPLYSSGCHFMGLFIDAGGQSVAFAASYLVPPIKQPLGTPVQSVGLNWNCIPSYNLSYLNASIGSTTAGFGSYAIKSINEVVSSEASIVSRDLT